MYTAITVIIILTCVLLVLVVLAQNPKGGGISSGIIGSNQLMGVKKTTEFIEKLTWILVFTLIILCMVAGMALPSKEDRNSGSSLQEQLDKMPAAPAGQKQLPQQQPAQQQPGQQPQPATPTGK
ncbi:MAG: preprotein translocase subunit SecG [Bacteroidia bacterium]